MTLKFVIQNQINGKKLSLILKVLDNICDFERDSN